MSISFLSLLPAPVQAAPSAAKASDLMARPTLSQEFGQALARSVSNAQHHARREQAALEAKSAEARRADANRAPASRTAQAEPSPSPKDAASLERSGKPRKAQAEDSKDKKSEEFQGKDPSSAALGVLDWLGGQVKAQALGRSAGDAPIQAADPLAAGKGHASGSQAVGLDEAQASNASAPTGAHALARPGSDETGSVATQHVPAPKPDAPQVATAAKPGDAAASGMDSAALLKPDAQAVAQQADSQSLKNPEGFQDVETPQGLSSSQSVHAPSPTSDSRPGAALTPDTKRGTAVRASARAAPGAAAQAALAPLSQPALSKASAPFSPTTSAGAAQASVSAQAAGSADPDSAHASGGHGATAFKAATPFNTPSTSDAFSSLAPDTSTSAPATSDTLALPTQGQAVGHWGQLEPEVGTPAWHQALSQQIMQMRGGNEDQAELQLNPLGLGPLCIKLSLREHELNAEFSSAHVEVREALEAGLPQLREALQQGGLQLGQAVVDTGTQSGQNSQSSSGFAGSGAPGQDSQSRASSRPHKVPPALQALRNPAADALAAQSPRQGPGQRLNTFA